MGSDYPMTFRLTTLILALGLAASVGVGQDWHSDWDSATKAAGAQKRAILLLFTVEEACEGCRALDAALLLPESAWTADLVRVRLSYLGGGPCPKPLSILGARARLRGYPTLYLCDSDGWPFATLQGFCPKGGAADVANLRAELRERDRPRTERARGESGLRKLLAWYTAKSIPLGETMVMELLWDSASSEEKAAWAPSLIATKLAAEDLAGEKAIFAAVESADPENKQGHLGATLLAAANVLLRSGDLTAAGLRFERLLGLAKTAASARVEAEMGLGYVYRKLGAPCLAKQHYEAGARAAEKTLDEKSVLEHSQRQVQRLDECPPVGCGCAQKRLKN